MHVAAGSSPAARGLVVVRGAAPHQAGVPPWPSQIPSNALCSVLLGPSSARGSVLLVVFFNSGGPREQQVVSCPDFPLHRLLTHWAWCCSTSRRVGEERMEPGSCLWCPTRTGGTGHKLEHGRLCLNTKKHVCAVRVPRGAGVSLEVSKKWRIQRDPASASLGLWGSAHQRFFFSVAHRGRCSQHQDTERSLPKKQAGGCEGHSWGEGDLEESPLLPSSCTT